MVWSRPPVPHGARPQGQANRLKLGKPRGRYARVAFELTLRNLGRKPPLSDGLPRSHTRSLQTPECPMALDDHASPLNVLTGRASSPAGGHAHSRQGASYTTAPTPSLPSILSLYHPFSLLPIRALFLLPIHSLSLLPHPFRLPNPPAPSFPPSPPHPPSLPSLSTAATRSHEATAEAARISGLQVRRPSASHA